MKHLLTTAELSASQIRKTLSIARAFTAPVRAGETVPLLSGMTVVNLFFENSTRTRSSFEVATRKLGGASLNFAASNSSVQKGETLIDTAMNIVAMQPHCMVVRHA